MDQPSLLIIEVCALATWLVILFLPWQPWRVREILEELPAFSAPHSNLDLSDISVLIPARNESAVIQETLEALKVQGRGFKVILVDDGSSDGTADIAREVGGISLEIISGKPLPAGWKGKPWALEQGLERVDTIFVLLLDADIWLTPGLLSGLLQVSKKMNRPFVSVMAELPMKNFWEKLLSPAFIYFFKMLYPFSLANSADKHFASAAGGCILIERKLLAEIGGFDSIKEALIDDCALAKQIKRAGFRTWTGQSRLVKSRRGYASLSDFWAMVARSAYTQLNYSIFLLLLTSLAMCLLFIAPLVGLFQPSGWAQLCGLLALTSMAISYQPTLRFYRLSPFWALLMPFIGCLYLAMTWSSAISYYGGRSGSWKGRTYKRNIE